MNATNKLRAMIRVIQDQDSRLIPEECVDILDRILAVDSGEDAWKDWEFYTREAIEKIRLQYNTLDVMNLGVSVAFTWDKSGEGGVEAVVHKYKEMAWGTCSSVAMNEKATTPEEVQSMVRKALEYLN